MATGSQWESLIDHFPIVAVPGLRVRKSKLSTGVVVIVVVVIN